MSKRTDALASGQLTYNSGKPCSRGHVSDRYTSNGSCIQCLAIANTAVKNLVKINRTRYVRARMDNLMERKFFVRDVDRQTLQQCADILHFATPAMLDDFKSIVEAIYEKCPNPKALTRDDLLKFMDYRDGIVHNHESLIKIPATHDTPLYIMHNGQRYVAMEMMDVLRGEQLNVVPK